jgi:hypothetical protein
VSSRHRAAVLALLLVSLALLIPGLFAPVLIIRGVLTRDGVARVAPQLLERGLDEETIASLKTMMNPAVVGLLQLTGGDLRKTLIDKLTPQLIASLQKSAGDFEVYQQTRSIVGSVGNLYEVGSPVPATLILLFSVIVPVAKAVTVAWAMFIRNTERRDRALAFVASIAKWSMADVFVVALFIAYLAANATQSSGDPAAPPLVAFDARFGSGFYWFAAYCVFSLASQQYTVRLARKQLPA